MARHLSYINHRGTSETMAPLKSRGYGLLAAVVRSETESCWLVKTNKSIRVTSAMLDATGRYLKHHLACSADTFHFTLGQFASPHQQTCPCLSWSILEVSWSICQEAGRGCLPFGQASLTALLTCLAPIRHHSKHLPFVCLKPFRITFNSTAQRNLG